MVLYLPKYYLDFCIHEPYFVKYYLDSKLGKLPLLCTVTVNMGTSISKLGRVLFHNNSYIRSTLFFTNSCSLGNIEHCFHNKVAIALCFSKCFQFSSKNALSFGDNDHSHDHPLLFMLLTNV